MQNYIKTETRLVFIQFIFSSLFSDVSIEDSTEEFENYFYKLSVSSIDQKNEKPINFNKNFFKKLTKSYDEFIKTLIVKQNPEKSPNQTSTTEIRSPLKTK